MSFKVKLLLATACAILAGSIAATASAEPAVVFNYGQENSTCSGSGYGGFYVGTASSAVYLNGALKRFACHATLVSGTPVDSTQASHVDYGPGGKCTDVFTPSGVLNYECVLP